MTIVPAPQSVLVVLMGSLGDVVRGFSILSPIRKSWPNTKISWLVEPKCAPLVKLHPLIDQVIVFQRSKSFLVTIKEVIKTCNKLRGLNFDLVLDMQRHFKSGLFSFVTGAKRRLGFAPANSKEFNCLFNTEFIEETAKTAPKINNYQLFLDKLQVGRLQPIEFGLSKPSADSLSSSVRRLFEQGEELINIVIGSSWESKNIPPQINDQIVSLLAERSGNCKLVLIGGADQYPEACRLESKFRGCINLVGKTTLNDLVFLCAQAKLTVGPDSGPSHLVSAFKKKAITIFGPTDPRIVAPYGNEDLCLSLNLSCGPCYRRFCPGFGGVCLTQIKREQLEKLICSALA